MSSASEPAFVLWVRDSTAFEIEEVDEVDETVLVNLQDADESDVDDLRNRSRLDGYVFEWSVSGQIQLSRQASGSP